jgi:hypothetical protein
VNVAEDAELRLVRLLADAAPSQLLSPTFVQECEECMIQADAASLLETIVADKGAMAALFALEPLEEAVSAFSLLAALLDRVDADDPNAETKLAVALADAVIDFTGPNGEDTTAKKITFLSTLYNIRCNGQEKCALLTRMVKLAEPDMLNEGQALGNLITPENNDVPRIVAMLDAWNVPVDARRQLYQAVAAHALPGTRKQRFTLLLVDTYKDASQVDDLGLAAAKEAAIGAIQDPVTLFMQQRGMLTMPAIQALKSNSDTTKLYALLTVFQEGKLDDYTRHVKENGGESAVLQPYGLSSEQCIHYMRILSLCSLAAEQEEIPYTTIANTLELESVDQVESWVIAAVSSGLLVAKMDQLEQKVMVERAVVRKFDMDQWKALQSRLHLWKKNVSGILEAFKQTQATSANL